MNKKLSALTLVTASALALGACSSGTASSPSAAVSAGPQNITLWLAGGDTPDALRDYLKTTYQAKNGGTLTIEEQAWPDLVTKLTTALPDENNTPDVVEIGNTQSPTFTNVRAFSDISDMYLELGGDKLLQSFVEVGKVDGKNYTLPYYFGSRYMFYRKDIYSAAGVSVPKTLDEFNATVKDADHQQEPEEHQGLLRLLHRRPRLAQRHLVGLRQRRRTGQERGGQWTSTLSDPNTIKGLTQLQGIFADASKAPKTAKDQSPWLYINDSDVIKDDADNPKKVTGKTSLAAATIMAPGWAHWSIGDLKNDKRVWNDDKFGVFVLPGNDGKPAPVFAGGSNIGISAKSKNQGRLAGSMKIIFSPEYQQMLGK